MRATALLREHGRPPVVESVAESAAGEGEAVVEMAVAALNPVDLRVRDGDVAPEAPLPRIPGIEGVGSCDGDLVLVSGFGLGLARDGTLAERIAVPRAALRPVPAGVAAEQAACCGVVGATAVRVVALAELTAEDRVLVLGAGGAVGQALCRLSRDRVAETLGQVRSEGAAAAVAEAGAEPVLASGAEELAVAIEERAPSVVLDALGGDWTAAAIANVPARARIVLFGASAGTTTGFTSVGLYRRSLSLRGYSGMSERPELLSAAVDEALAAVAEGRLSFPVAARVPLDRVAEAYIKVEDSGTRAKVLVDLAGSR